MPQSMRQRFRTMVQRTKKELEQNEGMLLYRGDAIDDIDIAYYQPLYHTIVEAEALFGQQEETETIAKHIQRGIQTCEPLTESMLDSRGFPNFEQLHEELWRMEP